MKFFVWLNDRFIDYSLGKGLAGAVCRQAAIVDAAGPEEVFGLAQNVEAPWTDGFHVDSVQIPGARSLSVGDLVKEKDGPFRVVENTGFRELSAAEVETVRFE